MKNLAQLLKDCDADIRSGRPQDVARRLVKISPAKVPREWQLPLANICRRAGFYSLGLKLLTGIIFPRHKNFAQSTPAENAGYAMLLLRSGAVAEAVERLRVLDMNQVPEALLYRAFAYFLRWQYEEAIPCLEQYLTTPLAPYAELVGRTNLAFAYVETRRHERALALLKDNFRFTGPNESRQLQSTWYALRAQVLTQEGAFLQARAELDCAYQLLAPTQGSDHLFVMKRKLVLDGLEFKNTAPFEGLRALANEHNDWEALREADLYHLKIGFEKERFDHLYFGSPFSGFRNLFHAELGAGPAQLFYIFGPKHAPQFDLRTGEIDGKDHLNEGGKCHQLIQVLLQDLYQPLRTAGIFSSLYPGEQFDVTSSPDRVRQLVRRTRRWFESARIPVQIVESEGFYQLRIHGLFSFRMSLDRPLIEPHSRELEVLQESFSGDVTFSAREAEQELNLPKWTVHKIIKSGIARGQIERLGNTNRVAMYKIPPKQLRKVS